MQRSGLDDTATLDAIQRELAVLIRRALRGTVLHTGGRAHRLDLAAYALLVRLVEDGPQRSGDLARAFGLDKSTMSRQVAALERAGLVSRVDDPLDGRAFLVSVSAEGELSLGVMRAERRRVYRELLGHWSDRDRADFARLLARFNADMTEAAAHRDAER